MSPHVRQAFVFLVIGSDESKNSALALGFVDWAITEHVTLVIWSLAADRLELPVMVQYLWLYINISGE